ncbi:MAG: aldolase/citrate lyase family protein [Sulfolobales archaeon]|nr:aldolase/citrate lyase family protein [Sulfolobales archaeon]
MHPLLRKVSSGSPALGTWITVDSPEVAEALSLLPLDFVVIDLEHSPLGYREAEHILISLKGETAGIVRVPWNSHVEIKRALDIGAHGILVPWVNSGEEARQVARSVLYPPRGIRGFGPRRASLYGHVPLRKYFETYEEDLIVMVQVETRQAVQNLEEILAVETVNGILVGPNDLSASLGIYGMYDRPEFVETVREIASKSRGRKPLVAFFAPTLNMALEAYKMGYNMISFSADIFVLVEAYKSLLHEFKRAAGLS